jgi:hypothetical protein
VPTCQPDQERLPRLPQLGREERDGSERELRLGQVEALCFEDEAGMPAGGGEAETLGILLGDQKQQRERAVEAEPGRSCGRPSSRPRSKRSRETIRAAKQACS